MLSTLPGETTSSSTEADRIENVVNTVETRMRRGLTLDFLPLALQVLAGTLAVLPPQSGRPLRETLATQTPLLSVLVRILRGRDVGSRARDAQLSGSGAFAHLPTQEGQGGNGEISSELLKECIRLSLQLLGNLVYGCDVAKVIVNMSYLCAFCVRLICSGSDCALSLFLYFHIAGCIARVGCSCSSSLTLCDRLPQSDQSRMGLALCAQRVRQPSWQPNVHSGTATPGSSHSRREAKRARIAGGDEHRNGAV